MSIYTEKLLTLLKEKRGGFVVVAVFDQFATVEVVANQIKRRLPIAVHFLPVDREHLNIAAVFDRIIQSGEFHPGDVLFLRDLERADAEVFGFLDQLREEIRDRKVPVIVWVTPKGLRRLAEDAPNFYAYRVTSPLDFTKVKHPTAVPAHSVPRVFLSSTAEDLGDYRAAARDAVLRAGYMPDMQEYWVARDNPPLAECLERVANTDVLVIIAAHRYGWVPADQAGKEFKSITWLECEQAAAKGLEILAFVLDDSVKNWPDEAREDYALRKAMEAGNDDVKLYQDTQRRIRRLKDFKDWLKGRVTRETFVSPQDVRGKIESSLRDWRERHPEFTKTPIPEKARQTDPTKYLRDLRTATGYIDIRGLAVGSGKAHRFPIDELYIELSVVGGGESESSSKAMAERGGQRPLHEALGGKRVVVIGDPGAGKTTFLNWVAWVLAGDRL
ncbi:MAG: DUF4062 domain-containing protein, partial [Gammaproteobacteria bacterium]|nr:DUF4062 domain-containing protein [Gammaproteobacteria bacterium]